MRAHPLWLVTSAAAHAIMILVLVIATRPVPVERRITIVALEPPGTSPREYLLPALGAGGGRGGRAAEVDPSVVPDSIPAEPETEVAVTGGAGADSAGPIGPTGTRRRLGPAYADGRLWVRGSEARLGVVGPSDDVATHVARVDSAIRARIKAYIDTMPRDSFALPAPPRWTTDVSGETWGIDPQWIYLGDIKLPTALLALLPFPQGNIDQAYDAQRLLQMRQDIIQAARRAESADMFRTYVDQVRMRKAAEREAARAAKRDTITPLKP